MCRRLAVLVFVALVLAPQSPASGNPKLPAQPKAPKHPTFNFYWGERVEDDYQNLERVTDPGVVRWAKAQNGYARAWLDHHPERKAILKRVVELTHSDSPDYYGGSYRNGTYFFLKDQPPKQQPFLVTLTSVMDTKTERAIVDPNAIDSTGGTSIDFYAPSLDGKYAAVSLSKNGTEDGTLQIYETATGRRLDDTIPRVNGGTAGGSAAWNADASGIYYTRYPHEGERPAEELPFYQQIYYHKLGTPIAQDTYVLGKEFPKIAEIELSTSPDGRYLLADVSNGDGGEHAYWLRGASAAWTQVTRFEDGIVEMKFGMDDALYLLSRNDAPRKKILRLPLEYPDLHHAAVIIPETENAIEGYTPTATRVYVTEMVGGPTQMRVYELKGHAIGLVTMSEVATMGTAMRTSGDDVLVRSQSYTHPPALYRYGSDRTGLQETALAQVSP
ncbi:MAG TPA: S9 family peptidase, partial [Candidatus Eisenbacteria bacterium]